MPGILCEHCTALCCQYIALPIETPRTRADFDDVRWYLLHEGISVFVEEGDWYLCIATTCRHLEADQRCGIYPTRPRLCRQYSTSDCDYHSGDYDWEQHFTGPEHLEAYVRAQPAGAPVKKVSKHRNGRIIKKAHISSQRQGTANNNTILHSLARGRRGPSGGRAAPPPAPPARGGIPLPVLGGWP